MNAHTNVSTAVAIASPVAIIPATKAKVIRTTAFNGARARRAALIAVCDAAGALLPNGAPSPELWATVAEDVKDAIRFEVKCGAFMAHYFRNARAENAEMLATAARVLTEKAHTERDEAERLAEKSARNAWSNTLAALKLKAHDGPSGANNKSGKNGKVAAETVAPVVAAPTEVEKAKPVTSATIFANALMQLATIGATAKKHAKLTGMVRLQEFATAAQAELRAIAAECEIEGLTD